MKTFCKSIGCCNAVVGKDFCEPCLNRDEAREGNVASLSERYPERFKPVGDMEEIDIFAVHHLFQMPDPSGCLQHASRLLLQTSTSDNQSIYQQIREARDTLTRWLQLNQELVTA